MRVFTVFLLILGFSACTEKKMNPSYIGLGKNVKVLNSSDAIADCEYLGPLRVYKGANFRTYEQNYQTAHDEIRDRAAGMGATHLVITSSQETRAQGWASSADKCNNCVEVQGMAYRCKTEE